MAYIARQNSERAIYQEEYDNLAVRVSLIIINVCWILGGFISREWGGGLAYWSINRFGRVQTSNIYIINLNSEEQPFFLCKPNRRSAAGYPCIWTSPICKGIKSDCPSIVCTVSRIQVGMTQVKTWDLGMGKSKELEGIFSCQSYLDKNKITTEVFGA